MVLDDGTLLHCNQAAEDLLRRSMCVQVRAGRLWMVTARAYLDKAYLDGQRDLEGDEDREPIAVRFVVHAQGRGPRLFADARSVHLVGQDAWLVSLFCVSSPKRPHVRSLRCLLGLTPAESRLVAAIYRNPGVKAVARELSVSYETARSQLRQVFHKCEVSNQAELVRLIADGPFF
jgi:DNA-binding CsgD family transcriptional regulator